MKQGFAIVGGRIFDGSAFRTGQAMIIADQRIAAILPMDAVPPHLDRVGAEDGLVVPGFVDLQVNGGGGVLFNNQPTVAGIRQICRTHARFGTTALLPTLITDRPDILDAALDAGRAAAHDAVPGYLGLHLEGPHLALSRKGTHDPSLLRPMEAKDLESLSAAAGHIGRMLLTVAPESVSIAQVATLSALGFAVSLGHSDVQCAVVEDYVVAGARLVTHLFNAMSPLGNREPGLVGAALADGRLHCGIIADGIHVDPVTLGIALRAKQGPGRIFLVTDAMSTIGTQDTGFLLNGRAVYRREGRLTLADGTLAGADIDMLSCVKFVHQILGVSLGDALNMASLYPAEALGCPNKGRLGVGMDADFLILSEDLLLRSTWIGGCCVHQADTCTSARPQ